MRYKNYTPEGTQDILFDQCYMKNTIENRFTDLFKAYGYFEIETPTFEFYDVFTQGKDSIATESMFKFYDNKGRILVLRPDMTVPIARVTATKFNEQKTPIRISYSGSVYRFNESSFDGQKEIVQTGIELIGIKTPEADAEVISIAVNSLINAGFKNFQIDIGQIEFFKGLMEEGNFTESEIEGIRGFIDKKDMFGVEEILREHELDENLKEIIMDLPKYFGSVEILETLKKLNLNEKSQNALKNLENVVDILKEYDLIKYISIDLGMVQKLNYYTGVIFKGFTYGVGFPILSGGRYDNLVGKYGKPRAAVGFSINMNLTMTALERQKIEIVKADVNSVIGYSKEERRTAFTIATQLRARGKITEMDIENRSFEDLMQYAKENCIEQAIYISEKDIAIIYKPKTNETIKMTVSDLFDCCERIPAPIPPIH